MSGFTHSTTVDGQELGLYAEFPDGAGPFPVVVVIQHAAGVDEFIVAMVARLAQAGYGAVAPQLYHRLTETGPPLEMLKQLRDDEVIADVNAAIDWLATRPVVDVERMGIMGFCMGGRVSYMMAAVNPRLRAAVAYYGGNIMKSWGDDGLPTPFERTADIGCPLLFHFGAEDANPSPEDMQALDRELARHGKPHEFHSYPGAGHAFMDFTSPARYRELADRLSWPRTLQFLARCLGAGGRR